MINKVQTSPDLLKLSVDELSDLAVAKIQKLHPNFDPDKFNFQEIFYLKERDSITDFIAIYRPAAVFILQSEENMPFCTSVAYNFIQDSVYTEGSDKKELNYVPTTDRQTELITSIWQKLKDENQLPDANESEEELLSKYNLHMRITEEQAFWVVNLHWGENQTFLNKQLRISKKDLKMEQEYFMPGMPPISLPTKHTLYKKFKGF